VDISNLIPPEQLKSFEENVLGKKPLLLRPAMDNQLPNRDALWELVQKGYITYPSLQIANNGKYQTPSEFAVDIEYSTGTLTGVLIGKEVADQFLSGKTLVFNAISRFFPELSYLCKSIADRWQCITNANAYLTPPNAKGFSSHFDIHDVFIIQLSGTKEWTIHEPIFLNNKRIENANLPSELPPPELELTLTSGDILYLPTGYIHSAKCTTEESLHITIGVTHISWYDIARAALKSNKNHKCMLERVPIKDFSRANLSASYRETLNVVLQQSVSEIIDEMNKNGSLSETFSSDAFQIKLPRISKN